MPRRPSPKQLLKQQERFKAQVTAYLASLGICPGHSYQYELSTPARLLQISVYGSWIATRFDDVELGRSFTGSCGLACNQHSGKWNFHYGPESFDPDQALADFRFQLDRLMTWQVAAA